MPQRIQRKREAGWRMPPGVVYVGRPGAYGNPYIVVGPRELAAGDNPYAVASRAEAVERYRELLRTLPHLVDQIRRELAGRDLACWCALPGPGQPDHCHAQVLLAVAAGADP